MGNGGRAQIRAVWGKVRWTLGVSGSEDGGRSDDGRCPELPDLAERVTDRAGRERMARRSARSSVSPLMGRGSVAESVALGSSFGPASGFA